MKHGPFSRLLMTILAVLVYGGLTTIALVSSVLTIAFFTAGSRGAGLFYLVVTAVLFILLIYLDTPERH